MRIVAFVLTLYILYLLFCTGVCFLDHFNKKRKSGKGSRFPVCCDEPEAGACESSRDSGGQSSSGPYFAAVLASNHKVLQELSALISEEGPQWIKAAAFNDGEVPSDREMADLVTELEKLGFYPCGIRFDSGEIKLDLKIENFSFSASDA